MNQKSLKEQLSHFGRAMALLLNRTLMYQPNHPVIKQSSNDVLTISNRLMESISPLVFILNRNQFYIDEEPLDPRINTTRIAGIWKNNDIQSISFESGLKESELTILTELFAGLLHPATARDLKDGLIKRGVFNIKINHVTFKKVTADDQVISRDALKKATPLLDSDDEEGRKKFMETVLESVLSEEFVKTLNITNLMDNPRTFTQKMIEADLAGTQMVPGGISTGGSGGGNGETAGPGIGAGAGPGDGSGPGDGAGQGTGTIAYGPGSDMHGRQEFRSHDTGTLADDFTPSQSGAGDAAEGGTPTPRHTGGGGGAMPQRGSQGMGGASQDASGGGAEGAGGAKAHGSLLIQQLEMMHLEVEKHLHGEGEISITDLAQAIFDMKKQLLEGIQAQKALGIAFANEKEIVEAANKMTDQVLVELIKEEYKAGSITPTRLAYFIRRLIPEAAELKRLLPLIKKTLMTEGMPGSEYLKLIHELRHELENEELVRALHESADSIGVEGDELIEEIRRNPNQAAELIYLASEVRKGGGDETALADILVEYVDRISSRMAQDAASGEDQDGEAELKKVLTGVESSVLKKLKDMNLDSEILTRMEQRINERLESILDKMRVEYLNVQSGGTGDQQKPKMLSVLQTLEHNVGDDEELDAILKIIRAQVDAGEIEENNFSQIHKEIEKQKRIAALKSSQGPMQEGILSSDDLLFIIEKEIARARRFGTPFSALALAFVTAKPKTKAEENQVTIDSVLNASLDLLANTFRETDYLGKIGKNRILVVLPMSTEQDSKNALARILRVLHAAPLDVNGVPVDLRVAGVAAHYDTERALEANVFAKDLSNMLADMVSRIKNIQVLF